MSDEVWCAFLRVAAERSAGKGRRSISADAVTYEVRRGRPSVRVALAELESAGLIKRVPARRAGEVAWWLVREADEADEAVSA